MPNTLTDLIPDAYKAFEVVSREMLGFIPSVYLDPTADQIAQGETIRFPVAPANSAGKDITAAMAFPTAAYQTFTNKTHALSKARAFPFSWSAEQRKDSDKGPGFLNTNQQQIAQAIRAAINEIETDVATAVYKGASRAYGTAGTAPFASDLSALANVKKIHDDNLTPSFDRAVVMGTTAATNLTLLSNLFKVNESGDTSLLRQGVLGDLLGYAMRVGSTIPSVTKGTGASYLVNGALSAGATTITADTGSGTILAGDIVTFAGDTNKYVVASALSGGSFTIASPGLRAAVADNVAITVGNSYTANVALQRNSTILSTRVPAADADDLASDRQVITDPVSGISIELAVYPGYRMTHYEVGICWGVTVVKPDDIAIILG